MKFGYRQAIGCHLLRSNASTPGCQGTMDGVEVREGNGKAGSTLLFLCVCIFVYLYPIPLLKSTRGYVPQAERPQVEPDRCL